MAVQASGRQRAPITRPTTEEITAAVAAGYDKRPGIQDSGSTPAWDLSEAINSWWSNVIGHGIWERWPCDSDQCPATPAYDDAIGLSWSDLEALTTECAGLIGQRLATMAEIIAERHPDAPRAVPAAD